ncbi:MFS transporter [Aspergillus foveolatus]|uniref:MFS transporter n=1 Tax=Aspergillus foveolatus TaxID=210207 RepID=UPI003CCD55F2
MGLYVYRVTLRRSSLTNPQIVPVTPTALNERAGIAEGDEQSWTSILLGLYGGALLASSPPAGYLADRIESRRWPLILGLVALGASTALLCVGTHIGLWIAGRLCQGVSAAVVWTVGCALLVDTVDKDGLGQALGYIGMGMTFGAMGGPLLGGVLYEHGGYYSVFALAFALIALDIVFRVVMIEGKDAVQWLAEDEQVQETVSGTLQLQQPDDIERQEDENEHEKRSSEPAPLRDNHPFPPSSAEQPPKRKQRKAALLTLLASSRILVALWAYFILSLLLTSFDSVLPLFVDETFHWKQTAQGLVFIPLTVPHTLDPIFGYINDNYPSSRRYLAGGAFFATVPVLVCLRLVKSDSIHDIILLCALLALVGVCIAAMFSIILVEVSYVVQEKEDANPGVWGKGGAMALAYGVSNSAWAGGSLAGPFLAGFIRENAGWGTMAWVLALVVGSTGVPVLGFIGGWVSRRREGVGRSERQWRGDQQSEMPVA